MVWVDSEEGWKGRFVQGFSVVSKQWEGERVRMDTKGRFAALLKRGDMLSFDGTGYSHFFLHANVRNFYLFR